MSHWIFILEGGHESGLQIVMTVMITKQKHQLILHLASCEKQLRTTAMVRQKMCLLRFIIIIVNLMIKRGNNIGELNVRTMRNVEDSEHIIVSEFEKNAPLQQTYSNVSDKHMLLGKEFSAPLKSKTNGHQLNISN